MTALAINGRFVGQRFSGVQRFATEITAAWAALPDAPRPTLLLPQAAPTPPWPLSSERVGSRGGQFWEQAELPLALRGRFLVNLGNTAPLLAGRHQAVVIHDAGVFDTPESYSLAFRSWYRLLHHGLAWRGARILTVSEFSRGRIAHHLGLPPERIGVVGEGGEHILRLPADLSVLAKYGLEPQRYALNVGNRAAHKNLGGQGEAAALLAQRGHKLAAVGGGGTVFAGTEAAQGAAVIQLGRVSDAELRALYENALCLIFPSRYEGFGLPPMEAFNCGCPVLAARAGSLPEVCGDAALWFDPAQPATLATALARLLDEPDLAATLRARGAVQAQRYTWPIGARALLRHLEASA
jgi:glycosyltransferase involved in cell wall biosynthesis